MRNGPQPDVLAPTGSSWLDLVDRVRRWLTRNGPETVIISLGIALRLSMLTNFDYRWSYDFSDHAVFIRFVASTFGLPPLDLTREAYHPPLFYFMAGALTRLGVGESRLGAISVVCGVLRLLVLRVVFARWLGRSSLAARVALLVAAVQPTSIHLEGMITGEGLSNLETAVVMWVLPPMFWPRVSRGPGQTTLPWGRAVALGVVLALALLTKVSALSTLFALGIGIGARVLWSVVARLRRPRAQALREDGVWRFIGGWVIVAAVVVGLSGWYFARNQRLYGKPFLSGFDGPDKGAMAGIWEKPLRTRRPAEYFYCWSNDIYRYPYYASGVDPRSCFWPQLVASSWTDFYRYAFSYGRVAGAQQTPILQAARGSVVAGTLLAVTAAITTGVLLWWAWKRRSGAALALLSLPIVALVGQLYFATAFPIDSGGMVKGLYMQFASPPLYATVGVAASWLRRRSRLGAVLAFAVMASIALVGFYSLACRFLPPPPG
jgi:hypothetical protein